MTLSELSSAEVCRRLGGEGLSIRTGPFVSRMRSRLPEVAEAIELIYAHHPVHDADDFADFDVAVNRVPGLRGWFRPQVVFTFDGTRPFTPLPANQGFPLLEWGLNWCVYHLCDQYLTMHSAVLERDGLAVLMPAPSGSGKSTLCAALAFRGWRLLSDELAVVHPVSGQLVPVPRPISLKNRSIEVIRSYAPDAVFSRPVSETLKGTVCHVRPPLSALTKSQEMARPRWVIFPKYQAGEPALLRPLSRARTFMLLSQQSFNYPIQGREGFRVMANLIGNCEGYEFSYGDLDDAIKVFDDLVMRSRLSA